MQTLLEKEMFLKGLNISNSARNEMLLEILIMKDTIKSNEDERELYLKPIAIHMVEYFISAERQMFFPTAHSNEPRRLVE
ncbi:hypothetical protein AB6A40_005661 [Gnathostoma spinigerum]|uniref:Uncharacterized protein n=1 Tax=Gnathostoma spinigerum TaxID=75299 RepID=A0ABD6EQW9_9BILA